MAAPLAIPALTGLAAKFGIGAKLASALGAAKTLLGMSKAAKVAGGVGSAMKAGVGLPGVVAGSGSRMAAQKLGEMAVTNPAFKSGIGKALFGNMSKGQIAGRLAPDAAFGVLAGAMTPGDLGDKLIAGSASTLGGGLGGIGLGRAASRFGDGASVAADFTGSLLGDMAAMPVSDALIRIKGGGMTPYEKEALVADQQYRAQLEEDILKKYGLA